VDMRGLYAEGARSGENTGPQVCASCLVHLLGHFVLRKAWLCVWKYGGAPSSEHCGMIIVSSCQICGGHGGTKMGFS